MARRHAEKGATQRATTRGAGAVPSGVQARSALPPQEKPAPSRIETVETRLLALEQERDFLAAQVEALKSRCRQLEDSQAQACNRLSWAIDSVQSILDNKG